MVLLHEFRLIQADPVSTSSCFSFRAACCIKHAGLLKFLACSCDNKMRRWARRAFNVQCGRFSKGKGIWHVAKICVRSKHANYIHRHRHARTQRQRQRQRCLRHVLDLLLEAPLCIEPCFSILEAFDRPISVQTSLSWFTMPPEVGQQDSTPLHACSLSCVCKHAVVGPITFWRSLGV